MVAPPFYNAFYRINLPNVTYIVAVGIYSVVRVIKQRSSNHDIASYFILNEKWMYNYN